MDKLQVQLIKKKVEKIQITRTEMEEGCQHCSYRHQESQEQTIINSFILIHLTT